MPEIPLLASGKPDRRALRDGRTRAGRGQLTTRRK